MCQFIIFPRQFESASMKFDTFLEFWLIFICVLRMKVIYSQRKKTLFLNLFAVYVRFSDRVPCSSHGALLLEIIRSVKRWRESTRNDKFCLRLIEIYFVAFFIEELIYLSPKCFKYNRFPASKKFITISFWIRRSI